MSLKIVCVTFLALVLQGCYSKTNLPLPTVLEVSLSRYLGTWYEIARYENRFEKGCVGASATYVMEKDFIRVINRCYDEKGKKIDEAQGKAYVVENSGNAKLRVSFFWPFYGDYWILKLASDYRYVVVGEPSRKYLWILAREKTLNETDKKEILEELSALGYTASMLYWTKN